MQHNRKSAITLWAILWIIWIALILLPESRGIFRVEFILLTVIQLTSSLILFWQHQRIRYINFIIIILILLPFILPGRSPKPSAALPTSMTPKTITPAGKAPQLNFDPIVQSTLAISNSLKIRKILKKKSEVNTDPLFPIPTSPAPCNAPNQAYRWKDLSQVVPGDFCTAFLEVL
jgi:hypothetical protein